MRTRTPIRFLTGALALALLSGCSGGSSMSPHSSGPQGRVRSIAARVPAAVSPLTLLKVNMHTHNHFKSFDSCPATGLIEYVGDFNNNVIEIFAGNFNGQQPCGMLTSANALLNPQGLLVRNHNLYVANTGGGNVLELARGGTSPINIYTDSSNGSEFPVDVTVESDGTVLASNIFGSNQAGSISAWSASGTLIGNYPNAAGANTYFLTVQKNGTVYYDDNTFAVYKGSCPAGVCGTFASTGATMAFPGGLRSADNEDVVLMDQSGSGGGDVIVFETFPNGKSCALGASDPVSFDINHSQHHLFYADAGNNLAAEVRDPATDGNICTLIGTVPGNNSGLGIGIAVDRPESLH